jgi:hypothetical protein
VTDDVEAALTLLRGGMPLRPLDARRIAGGLDQPGCPRRQLLDAASTPLDAIAELLNCPEAAQSTLALTRGNAFEQRVFDNGMAELIAIVRSELEYELEHVAQVDLSAEQVRATFGRSDNALRVRETRNRLSAMLSGDPNACCLIRHPMMTLIVGGVNAYLEADAVSFYAGGQLTTVEVKSFAAVDGFPDPAKTAAALRQAAVYIIALQDTVAGLGFDPALVSTRVLLVLTRDFSLSPVGFVRDIASSVRRLRRRLNSLPATAELAAVIPADLSLPALPGRRAAAEERRSAATEVAEVVSAIGSRFGDGCMSCPLFRFCRDEARMSGAVTATGSAVAEVCGDVQTVDAALDLASGLATPNCAAEAAVASHLGRAAAVAGRLAGNQPAHRTA